MTDEERTELAVRDVPVGMADPSGVAALAALSEEDFQRRMQVLEQGRARVQQIKEALMQQGTDYGLIPGTGTKPTLLKPGAEKLAEFYRLAAEIILHERHGDGIVTPAIAYVAECRLHLGSTDGPVVATGWGVCSNWEKKYRYRWEGSGTSRRKVDNPDAYDDANTIAKMSEKRAFVDAVLRATASSSLFTQDLEDMYVGQQGGADPVPEGDGQGQQRAAQPATADDAPICPRHNKRFRKNSRGYYCATKLPDDTWCREQPDRAWLAAQELS